MLLSIEFFFKSHGLDIVGCTHLVIQCRWPWPTDADIDPKVNETACGTHTGKFVFDTPKFYATVFDSKISWYKWPSSTPKIFGIKFMFSSMVWHTLTSTNQLESPCFNILN